MKSRIWFVTVGVRVALTVFVSYLIVPTVVVAVVAPPSATGRRTPGQRALGRRHGDDVLPRLHDQCGGVAYHPLRSTCPHERPVLPAGSAPGDDLPRIGGLQPQHSRVKGPSNHHVLPSPKVITRWRCCPHQLRGPVKRSRPSCRQAGQTLWTPDAPHG